MLNNTKFRLRCMSEVYLRPVDPYSVEMNLNAGNFNLNPVKIHYAGDPFEVIEAASVGCI